MEDDKDKPAEPFFSNPFSEPDPVPTGPNEAGDFAAPVPDPEPAPASMSMTKAELLERVHDLEEKLTKAQLLKRVEDLEGGKDADAEDAAVARTTPFDTTTRSATIDGRTLTWTEETEGQVPEEYRAIYARSKAAGG